MMDEIKKDRLPIDARLLSEIIIELNISRRSVALYPKGHPITTESVKRAFGLFEKLFEIRPEISLGISKDALIVDDYALDRKNPVFTEFSLVLHEKGIAAITFYSNMSIDELFLFHEIITSEENLYGHTLIEKALSKGLVHIKLEPIEVSRFQFVRDRFRKEDCGSMVIEDYIYGLLNGRLGDAETEEFIINTPPEEIASFLNESKISNPPEEAYERVITAYIRRKGDGRIRSDIFKKFISFIENLTPDLKKQFLKRAFGGKGIGEEDLRSITISLTPGEFDRILRLFEEHSSIIPQTLRNLINKLYETKGEMKLTEMIIGNRGVLHDIELDDRTLRLFQEDHFDNYVPDDYFKELEAILDFSRDAEEPQLKEIENSFRDGLIERTVLDIVLELTNLDMIQREDFLQLLTRLSNFVDAFIETGRFEEVTDVYNTIYSLSLSGRFSEEASSMINYFFRSERFIDKLKWSLKTWGSLNLEGLSRLARAMRHYIAGLLMDILIEEDNPELRKVYIHILSGLGSVAADEAAKRLDDNRSGIIRDMIYLIRKSNGKRYINDIRKFTEHGDIDVAIEALNTLLEFKSQDSMVILKRFLMSENPEIRNRAVMLAGRYKLRELIPYLLRQLERRDIIGIDSHYKKTIIHALAEIGDPSAINTLIRIFRSKTLLFRSSLEDIKVEIFKTLNRYPLDAVIPLAEMGLRSKNREIVSLSKIILEKAGKYVRT